MRRPISPGRSHRSVSLAAAVLPIAVVLLMVLSLSAGPSGASGSAATAAPRSAAVPAQSGPLPCYNINATICVSMQNSSEPDIIPSSGSVTSGVEPTANTTLAMYVESEYNLVWATAKTSGPLSPIGINLTGNLWNGVAYYSNDSDSVWHPQSSDWWVYGPRGANATYPYWYGINISAHGPSGSPNFFPGMNVTWWVYLTSNTSGTISHHAFVGLEYTYWGAFPYSPYPGAHYYAGSSAALEDVAMSQAPAQPNYNDTVVVNLTTTSNDLLSGAKLGGAYLDLTELAPDGAILFNGSFQFPVGTGGNYSTSLTIPATLAQTAGALVQYRITAWDMNHYGPDTIVTPTSSYSVNGNGSFTAKAFSDDLALITTPAGASQSSTAPTVIPEGTPVHVLLQSTNLSTSILTAEVDYTFTYAAIGEIAGQQVSMSRINSTAFHATIPGMPLNASVSYTVTAWDFAQDEQTSAAYHYATPSLTDAIATLPTNSTFFQVYVYDAGQHAWVSGASLTVRSNSGQYLKDISTTFLGVGYPNATGSPFVPLFLPAGEVYRITVNDSSFRPDGASIAPSVAISFLAAHALTANTILAVGPNYEVAESGNSIYFWLNQTSTSVTYSPLDGTFGGLNLLAGTVGLAGLALFAVPMFWWWQTIRAKRLKEERRITL